MNMREILFSRMANIYFGSLKEVLISIKEVVLPEIPSIVHSFFREIQEVDELAPIIENSIVTKI